MTPNTISLPSDQAPRQGRKGGPLTEQAAQAAIEAACVSLRLPTMRKLAGDAIAAAGRDHISYAGFLADLLLAEVANRQDRATDRRITQAGFPRIKPLGEFDQTANPHINPATIADLATCNWIRRAEPLCLIGDSGTGKSHLLIGLGIAAAEQGFKVKYTLATKLVNELAEARDDKTLAKTIARYGRVDLLIIDELGYMELDRGGAELLFQVLTEREETKSVAIASNQPFSGWTRTFTDPLLCAAIIDRLTFNGTIIETGTDSYRLAHTKTKKTN